MYEPEVGKITSDLDSLEKILGIENKHEDCENLVNSNSNKHLATQYTCIVCPFFAESKNKLEIHANKMHNFQDDIKIEVSQKSAQVVAENKEDIPVKCGDCEISFKSQGQMERHQKKYKCGKYASRVRVRVRGSYYVQNSICNKCGFSTNNQDLVTNHTCSILPKINCDKCPYSTRLVSNMDMHKSFEHMAPLKCSQCNYETKHNPKHPHADKYYKYSMSHHMEMHNVGNYDCFECDETFKVKHKLTYHIKSKHLQYICQDCNKKESSAYRLNQHIEKTHMHNVGNYECFECGETFKVKQNLTYHNKSKHLQYICKDCDKEESSAYRLNQHIRKTHSVIS